MREIYFPRYDEILNDYKFHLPSIREAPLQHSRNFFHHDQIKLSMDEEDKNNRQETDVFSGELR